MSAAAMAPPSYVVPSSAPQHPMAPPPPGHLGDHRIMTLHDILIDSANRAEQMVTRPQTTFGTADLMRQIHMTVCAVAAFFAGAFLLSVFSVQSLIFGTVLITIGTLSLLKGHVIGDQNATIREDNRYASERQRAERFRTIANSLISGGFGAYAIAQRQLNPTDIERAYQAWTSDTNARYQYENRGV